jgi:hypothetical protein
LLAANVAIVQRSGGKFAISDCLRRGLTAVGNTTREASTARLISACDQGTGVPALLEISDLYTSPAPFDLRQLWQKLGISLVEDTVIYTNDPQAQRLRTAILAPPTGFVPPSLPPSSGVPQPNPNGSK